LKVNQCFEATYRFHLQGRRISQIRNRREAGDKKISAKLQASSSLKKKTMYSTETSFDFQETFHNHGSEDPIAEVCEHSYNFSDLT
jgi:hypothetical protein